MTTPPVILYTITRSQGGQELNRAEHVALGQEWDKWPWLLFAMSVIENPEFEGLNYTIKGETISVSPEY